MLQAIAAGSAGHPGGSPLFAVLRPDGEDLQRDHAVPRVASVIPAGALGPEHVGAWVRLLHANPALESPFFRPEFTSAVASLRGDVSVAVLESRGRIAGFFPYQARGNAALPVGGDLSDYHGVVAGADAVIDPAALVRACGLRSLDYDHVPVSQSGFAPFHRSTAPSHQIDVGGGFPAYEQERRASGSRRIADTIRDMRRLERERGPVRFEARCKDPAVLSTLIRWKTEQYRRTGAVDVFSFPWTVQLLEHLLDHGSDDFSGMLSALWAGDRLVAAHLGMRSHGVLHFWFPAFDRELRSYSPGTILLVRLLQECAALGLHRVDLGKSDAPWKVSFATGSVRLGEGCVTSSELVRLSRRAWAATRSWIRSSPIAGTARAANRALRPLRAWLRYR